MELTKVELVGVRIGGTAPIEKPLGNNNSSLADIKKVIQPMLSKWAAATDLAIMREWWDSGKLDRSVWKRPKRGAKNWVSLRSDKKLHIFEIGTQEPDEETAHNTALRNYAKFLESFIELNFNQKVPVTIGLIPTYTCGTVTSGESSSTVFRGEEIEDDEIWF